MFQKGIDAKAFGEKLLAMTLYSSRVNVGDRSVMIRLKKNGDDNGED